MATFNITWSNAAYVSNTNVTGQRIDYRQKSLNGAYITTGFTPPNDLAKTVTSASVTGLLTNTVYQFRVAALCTAGGPTFNSDGVREAIRFACVNPTPSTTDTTITVTLTGLPVDITRVIFNIGPGPISVLTSGGSASYTFTGLTSSTSYTITTEFAAIVNGAEQVSTLSTCSITASTAAPATCPAPTGLAVTSALA